MKLAIIGTGYVGLVSGVCFAEWGNSVTCVDNNQNKIEGLKQGKLPIFEYGLDELLERNVLADRLSFTTDLSAAVKDADVVFIAVGTPPRANRGDADLSYVYESAKQIALHLRSDAVVVIKSTVPVGTGDTVERIIKTERGCDHFSVASNPEFLREGVAIEDFMRPDRVVIGVEDKQAERLLHSLYAKHLNQLDVPVLITRRKTSELIKYAANAFLATKITFINELADLCEKVGSDVADVAMGMGLDSRIGRSFLTAGPGYGGSCFPKDTNALVQTAHDCGVSLRIVQETINSNEARKSRMVAKVKEALGGDLKGRTVAVFGLAFKADTDDMRDSPSIPLIRALQFHGAKVNAYDPVCIDNARAVFENVAYFDDAYTCATHADAVVVVTEWGEFRELDLSHLKDVMRGDTVIDLRNVINADAANDAAIHLIGTGKPKPERRSSVVNTAMSIAM